MKGRLYQRLKSGKKACLYFLSGSDSDDYIMNIISNDHGLRKADGEIDSKVLFLNEIQLYTKVKLT